jgi:hypothetical protein
MKVSIIDVLKLTAFVDEIGVYVPESLEVFSDACIKENISKENSCIVSAFLKQLYSEKWGSILRSGDTPLIFNEKLDFSVRGLLIYGRETKNVNVGKIAKKVRIYLNEKHEKLC